MYELLTFEPTTPAAPWLPNMDIREHDGYLVVTAEPAPLELDGEATESGITERGWALVDRLGLPFHPDSSQIAARLVHGSLEVRLPLPDFYTDGEDGGAEEAGLLLAAV